MGWSPIRPSARSDRLLSQVSQPERDVLQDLIRRFLDEQLERSPSLRELARHLASLTLDRLDELERASSTAPSPADATPSVRTSPAPAPRAEPTAVVPLRIGDARIEVPVTGGQHAIGAARESAEVRYARDEEADYLERTARARSIDLELVARRCRLKVDSCRHQIVRQNQAADSPEEHESLQRMNELINRAKAMPDCFLWMFFRKGLPTGDEQLEVIAGCYEAMADAAALCHAIEPLDQWPDEGVVREALQLLSTTSSGLRVSLEETWLTQPDIDQDEVHQWLKLVTAEHRYHVRQHMQLSDPANPVVDVPAAREQAIVLLARIKEENTRREKAQRFMKKALYHAQKVRDAADSPYGVDSPQHDCQKVNEAIDALVDLDPPELVGMIRQLAHLASPDSFATDVPAHALLVEAASLNATNARSHSKAADKAIIEPETQARSWSDDVMRVRGLLDGGQIVVVGGEPRRDAIDRMIDAFALDQVIWPELTEHGTAEPMRAPITNPRTRLVVVIIKLTGHEHAERARDFAKQASVPFVLLPAGYNPEQIAAEVLKQVSTQLRSA